MRRLALALAALLAAASVGHAEDGIGGDWRGSYVCAQGVTGLTLSVQPVGGRDVRALFHFYPSPANPGVAEGCYEMEGTYDPSSRTVVLTAGAWLVQPPGYVTVNLAGTVARDGGEMAGRIMFPSCTTFDLHRVAARRKTPGACRPSDAVASLAP